MNKKGIVPLKLKVKPKVRWTIRKRDGQKRRETICFFTSI